MFLVKMSMGDVVLWSGQEVVSWGMLLEGELEVSPELGKAHHHISLPLRMNA